MELTRERLPLLGLISFFLASVLGITFLSLPENSSREINSEAEAISFISKQFPSINKNLQSKVFSSKLVGNDWYVAEIFVGPNEAVINANCYIIFNFSEIDIQAYSPRGSSVADVNPINCEGLPR